MGALRHQRNHRPRPHNREGPPRAIPDRKTTAPGSQRRCCWCSPCSSWALSTRHSRRHRSRPPTPAPASRSRRARRCSRCRCASCHGLNGEGQVTGSIQGPPLAGVGAAAVEFQVATGRMPMAHPGAAGAGEAEPVHRGGDRRAGRVRGHASAPARRSPSRSSTTRPVSARRRSPAVASCSGPTARPATTSRAPAARCRTASTRPSLIGVSNLHLYEAMLTGPQQMPVFSDGVLHHRGQAGHHRLPERAARAAQPGGLALGGLGPVAEGLWAWVVGIGVLMLFAIWIAAKGVKAR